MMLALLLDEQISPVIAEQVKRRRPDIPIHSLAQWQDGAMLGQADDMVLQAATAAGLTLVTYDLKTIPPLLVEWGAREQAHAGVIFIDNRTLPPQEFGPLMRALIAHWDLNYGAHWQGRIDFLRRA
jgi:hypothetical protein